MANGVLVVGPSGSGKSTAIRNLDPAQTFIIAPDKKSLPIKGWRNIYKTVRKDDGKVDMDKTNYLEISDPNQIISVLNYISDQRHTIEVVVITTISHIMNSQVIKTDKQAGNPKFTDLAVDVCIIYQTMPHMRDAIPVFVTGHTEVDIDADGGKITRLRTIGKMLNEKVTVESLFTVVLFTSIDLKDTTNPYGFETQTNGSSTAKSPFGMFESLRIPNDYAYVLTKISEYES